MPDWIGTFDLVSLPYPTRFGLFRAAISPAPYLSLTHRLVVVRWREPDGKSRVLLFEPTDVELARRTPYFARLRESTPAAFERAFARPLGDVVSHLRSVGIDTGDVDWITFDHLHTQDVRRWIGTTEPAQDLSTAAPARASAAPCATDRAARRAGIARGTASVAAAVVPGVDIHLAATGRAAAHRRRCADRSRALRCSRRPGTPSAIRRWWSTPRPVSGRAART